MATNTIGTLLIELKAKTDAFEKGMKSAKDLSFRTSADIVGSLERIGSSLLNLRFNNLDQAGRSLSIVGGIAAATGVALTTSIIAVAIKSADEIDKMGKSAEKAGMGIQVFSEYAYAAKRAEIPVEDFTNSMAKLNKTALSAAEGNVEAQKALRLAGTAATDSAGKLRPTDAILSDIIKRYDSLTDKTLKSALAQQVFGRSGAVLIPFLNQGSKGIEALRKEANVLGVAIGPGLLAQASQFHDSLEQMQAGARGMTLQFTAGLLPALNQIPSSLTQVTSNASAMHDFGETTGEAFRSIAKAIYEAEFAWEYWNAKTQKPTKTGMGFDLLNLGVNPIGALPYIGEYIQDFKGVIAGNDQGAEAAIQDAQRKRDERINALYGPSPKVTGETTGTGGTAGLNPAATNFADTEIAKLREKAQGTLALAAAELIGEQSVRATTAANQADAIILQIATKASKEHKTALQDEIAAAQKKYGATVLNLVTIDQEAARSEAFNKSLKDQTLELEISTSAHQKLTEAAKQGNDAIGEAIIQNQVDAALRKADIVLTEEQKKKVQEWTDVLRQNALAQVQEQLENRIKTANDAISASREMIAAQRDGAEAEIRAQAAQEVTNFEIANHTKLLKEDRDAMQSSIALQMRVNEAQRVAAEILKNYDPDGEFERKLHDISLAQIEEGITGEQAMLAVRDAILAREQQIDELLLKTQTFSGGAAAALRQFSRDAQDMAKVAYNAFNQLFDGINKQLAQLVVTGKASFAAIIKDFNQTITEGLLKKYVTGPIFTKIGDMLGLPGLGSKPGESPSNPLWIKDADKYQGKTEAATGAAGAAATATSALAGIPVVGGIISGIVSSITGASSQALKPDGTAGNPFHVRVDNQQSSSESGVGPFGGARLLSDFGSMFGASGGFGAGGFATDAGTATSGFPFLAGGGPVSPGNKYWVGDKGIELFTPDRPGYVHSNDSIRRALSEGSAGPNIVFNVSTPTVEPFKRSQAQLMSNAMIQAARYSARR